MPEDTRGVAVGETLDEGTLLIARESIAILCVGTDGQMMRVTQADSGCWEFERSAWSLMCSQASCEEWHNS